MFLILVSLYFVRGKSYEHSLIIYWTALVQISFLSRTLASHPTQLTYYRITPNMVKGIVQLWFYICLNLKNLTIMHWAMNWNKLHE